MTFNPDFAKRFLDSTEADAIRALREGGPFDTTIIAGRCKDCGTETEKTLRWFYNRDFVCTCGGQIDSEPLKQFLIERTAQYLLATKTPAEIINILENPKRDA